MNANGPGTPGTALTITCTGRQGPLAPGAPAIACVACELLILPGHFYTTIPVGCGLDPRSRSLARNALPFPIIFRPAHWACVTGDENESRLAL